MDTNQFAKILELFERVENLPEDERKKYLSQACREDSVLREEIEHVLAHEKDSSLLFQSLSKRSVNPYRNYTMMLEDLHLLVRQNRTVKEQCESLAKEELEGIENYKILEPIGEGGMGIVYLAEQIKPVKRRVALKIIKLGMDTKQVVARFEAERQALAVMVHPNIARVYDAGATKTGRPYFVMELVQGISITRYCDYNKLTTRDRLRLFLRVCQAVQHAHQKGVIHRDLKPSNVLVKFGDDDPIPKIIDFGIAKATEHRLTERTLFTEQGQIVGTPEYMSPEQAEMSMLDVDTRTDIYSLGVMLYELLVGVLPFDPKMLRHASYNEIQQTIRETTPPRASMRLKTLGESSPAIAKLRKTNPLTLQRQLQGDLDWIIMKAMAKVRTERYSSVSELIADVMRHLNNEPVLAGPPGRAYRLKKFIKKHKTGVTAASLVLLSMIIGIAGTSIGLIRAREEAKITREVSEFLVGLFKVSDPSKARGNSITAREILDRGAEKIHLTLDEQPKVKSKLMRTIGEVYCSLGLYRESQPLLEEALKIHQQLLGENHQETVLSKYSLAKLFLYEGHYSKAESLFLETLGRQKLIRGKNHAETLSTMNDLANVYYKQGRYASAESLHIETLQSRRRVLGNDHPETLASAGNLARLYKVQGRYSEALPLFLETLKTQRRVLGDDHPETLSSLNNLALLYLEMGRYPEAESLHIEALKSKRSVFGEDHPSTLNSMNNLAILYFTMGRYQEAESLYVKTLDIRRNVLGEDHPETLKSMNNLAVLYLKQSRYAEAETIFQKTLESRRRVLGLDHPKTLTSLYNIAVLSVIRGQKEKALGYLREALERGFEKDWIIKDPDLAPLHEDPEFEALIGNTRTHSAKEPTAPVPPE